MSLSVAGAIVGLSIATKPVRQLHSIVLEAGLIFHIHNESERKIMKSASYDPNRIEFETRAQCCGSLRWEEICGRPY